MMCLYINTFTNDMMQTTIPIGISTNTSNIRLTSSISKLYFKDYNTGIAMEIDTEHKGNIA